VTNYRTTLEWRGQKCETLADILAPGLACVFVGLNPSPVSVAAGHYLQGTLGKQFWRLLDTYNILPRPLNGAFPDELLLANGFGFTDLAKCPSPRAHSLTKEDIEIGRAELCAKIGRYRPRIVCSVYRMTLDVLTGRVHKDQVGLLEETIGETLLFAAPFPYKRAEVVATHMASLKRLIDEARN